MCYNNCAVDEQVVCFMFVSLSFEERTKILEFYFLPLKNFKLISLPHSDEHLVLASWENQEIPMYFTAEKIFKTYTCRSYLNGKSYGIQNKDFSKLVSDSFHLYLRLSLSEN